MRAEIISFASCSPQPDTRIITFGDDVGEAIVEEQLDLDVGILREKFLQLRPQDMADRISCPNRAARATIQQAIQPRAMRQRAA